MSHWR